MRVRILFLVILHGLLVVGCAQQVKMSKSVQPQATETESSREKKPHPEAVGLTQTPISGGQKIDPMTKDSFGSLDSIGLQNDKVPPVSAKSKVTDNTNLIVKEGLSSPENKSRLAESVENKNEEKKASAQEGKLKKSDKGRSLGTADKNKSASKETPVPKESSQPEKKQKQVVPVVRSKPPKLPEQNLVVLDLEEWVEPTTGITFRHIPDGCFYPGSPPNEKGRSSIENQGEEICLDSFWMSNTEITRDQWARLISDGRGVLGDKKPVTGQTWQHIQTFIYKLNDIYAGTRRFGLAKELQWEYACRGISNGGRNEPARYWEKAGLSKPCEFETISWNAEGCKILSPPTGPEKVGSHKPNGFGLYDMLGNVAEWTRDPLMPYQRKAGAQMLNVSSNRVVRGGRWNSSDPVNIRCALREKMHQNDTSESIGFRLVSEER